MGVVIGGIYEHYKKKYYKVLGVAKHSETLEDLVVYQPMYGDRKWWVRPEKMFCEKVVMGGTEVDRFKYIGDEMDFTQNT